MPGVGVRSHVINALPDFVMAVETQPLPLRDQRLHLCRWRPENHSRHGTFLPLRAWSREKFALSTVQPILADYRWPSRTSFPMTAPGDDDGRTAPCATGVWPGYG